MGGTFIFYLGCKYISLQWNVVMMFTTVYLHLELCKVG